MNGNATPSGPGPAGESLLHGWATGGAVLAACADLLVAVLLGLSEAPAAADRFTVRDLGLATAAVAFASFAVAAASWWDAGKGLFAAAAFHAAVASAGWFLVPRALGSFPTPALAAAAIHAACAALALAGAAAAGAGGAGVAGERTAWAARAAAENLESVLVAIVFALAIRHFAVEAYKIPTESMSPTLLGDSGLRGPGDRVLVAKWPALLGGPGRWQIWVFRPPLNRTINYVKRVAGLGGETVEIRDGDLYVDGAVARKPPGTREEMWFPVWPRDGPGAPDPAFSPWAGEGFRKSGEEFTVSGAAERRLLRYEPAVRDAVPGRSGSYEVGDVRLAFEVGGAEPGTVLVARVAGRAGPCEVRIAADGGFLITDAGGRAVPAEEPPGAPVRSLEVSFADLLLEVKANGRVLRRVECEPLEPGGRPSFGVSFGVEKGGATFRDVRLDRDVFYTGSWKFTVPEGHYLFLGDNSAASQDSRAWRGWEVRETAPGGRVFYSDARPAALTRSGLVEFTDRNGVFRSYPPGGVTFAETPLSFVPAADLHGRAFAIFWPPRWFTRMEGGRVRVLP